MLSAMLVHVTVNLYPLITEVAFPWPKALTFSFTCLNLRTTSKSTERFWKNTKRFKWHKESLLCTPYMVTSRALLWRGRIQTGIETRRYRTLRLAVRWNMLNCFYKLFTFHLNNIKNKKAAYQNWLLGFLRQFYFNIFYLCPKGVRIFNSLLQGQNLC